MKYLLFFFFLFVCNTWAFTFDFCCGFIPNHMTICSVSKIYKTNLKFKKEIDAIKVFADVKDNDSTVSIFIRYKSGLIKVGHGRNPLLENACLHSCESLVNLKKLSHHTLHLKQETCVLIHDHRNTKPK